MRRSESTLLTDSMFRLIVAGAVLLWLLVVGRPFLIPLAVAVLFANLLAALVERLSDGSLGGLRLPRWLALVAGLSLILAAVWALVRVLSGQADAIAGVWPQYVARFETLTTATVAYVGEDIAQDVGDAFASLNIARTVSGLLGSAGSLLSSALLVALYVAFLMPELGLFRRRLNALFGDPAEAEEAGRIAAAISRGIRRYVWIQTLLSLLTGAVSYAVLKLVGLDFAETWALLIFLLNYIPNVGSILGVVFPAVLALVQFATLGPFLVIAGVLTVVQFVIGNVLGPRLTGRSLNLSAFVIILSLTFWGSVWGIAGMFLSVPIMVMVMIMCSQVPRWRWVAVLLSEDGRVDGPPVPAR